MWLKIDAQVGLPKDLYLCVAYFPPQGSPSYLSAHDDIFSSLKNETQTHRILGNILIAGDLNARIGNLDDSFTFDEVNIPGLASLSAPHIFHTPKTYPRHTH